MGGKVAFLYVNLNQYCYSFIFIQTDFNPTFKFLLERQRYYYAHSTLIIIIKINQIFVLNSLKNHPYPKNPMDSEDNLSIHSSNGSSSHSDQQSSHTHSQNPSSASSSSHGQQCRDSGNMEDIDRHEDNTIGFDSFSEYSNNPLNKAFVRNEDSFFSDFKSLYSNRSKVFNQFPHSMDENDIENPYESNSFSSFQSFVSAPQVKAQISRKGSRERSRQRTKKLQKSSNENREIQNLEFIGVKKGGNGFKKRK